MIVTTKPAYLYKKNTKCEECGHVINEGHFHNEFHELIMAAQKMGLING